MPYAENALTTVEAVKKNLSGSVIEFDDDLIAQKINEVSGFIEEYCNRKFGKAVRTEKYEGTNTPYLLLKQYPVLRVISVSDNGALISTTEYELYDESGMLWRENGWASSSGRRQFSVEYESGYVLPKNHTTEIPRTLPYDLEGACITLTTIRYLNRDSENLTERRIGDSAEKFINDIPQSIKLMLNKAYKKVNA